VEVDSHPDTTLHWLSTRSEKSPLVARTGQIVFLLLRVEILYDEEVLRDTEVSGV
jgi:hypothetical protein